MLSLLTEFGGKQMTQRRRKEAPVWYKNVSKEEGVEIGVKGSKCRAVLSQATFLAVFPAEMYAIDVWALENLKKFR